jgi:predicted dienelactone hydrolase
VTEAAGGGPWSAGFVECVVPDPAGPSIPAGIWYPSRAPAAARPLGLNVHHVAAGGAIAGDGLPLVVVSHGIGGWFGGHCRTAAALARAGFVVVAFTHPGDNDQDASRALHVWDRPRHVGVVLDHVLAHWPGAARVDAGRMGIFGFSAGGFTALIAVGGVPDMYRIIPHCAAHRGEWMCRMMRKRGFDPQREGPIPDGAWRHDSRFRAAVIAAPALGFTFGPEGLAGVSVPVQLWRAADDEMLPHPWNAQAVHDALPAPPEYHVMAGARHFAFLPPCSPALAAAVPDICRDAPGFDRAAFHDRFEAEVARFLRARLGPATAR